jgi:hypothetical protein
MKVKPCTVLTGYWLFTKGMLRWLTILLTGLAAVTWAMWPGSDPLPPKLTAAVLDPDGLEAQFNQTLKIKRVRIFDAGGAAVLDQYLGGVRRSALRVYLNWPLPGEYTLTVSGSWGELKKRLRVAASKKELVTAQLLAPFDGSQKDTAQQNAAVAAGGTMTCALIIRQNGPGPSRLSGVLNLAPGLELIPQGLPQWVDVTNRDGRTELNFKRELHAPGQDLSLILRVHSPNQGRYAITARIQSQSGQSPTKNLNLKSEFSFVPPVELASKLEIKGRWLPTGIDGLFDSRKQPDTIYYKAPYLRKIIRWLGVPDERLSYWMPYAYHSIALQNVSDYHLPLVVKSRLIELDGERTPKAFHPPDIYSGGLGDNAVTAAVSLSPTGSQRVVLPIFITSSPHLGKYRLRVMVYAMGSSQPLKTLTMPLKVTGLDFTAMACTLASLLVSLVALGVLAWRFKPLLASFKVRQVVIIALFGALTFAGVNLPLKVFGALFYGLLGPFSVLVIGLFNEVLYYALLVTIVRMIPSPGVVSLLTLVRYLLSVLITGGFHLSDFMYVGTSIAVKESALYLTGVTRKSSGFNWSWPAVCVLAMVLALGDSLLNLTSIYVHMVLFRLYFADWFITLNVLFNGMAYTMLGVWLGKRFSNRLIWAEE